MSNLLARRNRPLRARAYLLANGWEYRDGSGAHSYWKRPADHSQKKPGKIYIRQIAVQIQRSVDRENYLARALQSSLENWRNSNAKST